MRDAPAAVWPPVKSVRSGGSTRPRQATQQTLEACSAQFAGHAKRADDLRRAPGGSGGNTMRIGPGRKAPVAPRPSKAMVRARAAAVPSTPGQQQQAGFVPRDTRQQDGRSQVVFQTEVRGMRFYAGALALARSFAPSQRLYCEREPSNTTDPNAIKVFGTHRLRLASLQSARPKALS